MLIINSQGYDPLKTQIIGRWSRAGFARSFPLSSVLLSSLYVLNLLFFLTHSSRHFLKAFFGEPWSAFKLPPPRRTTTLQPTGSTSKAGVVNSNYYYYYCHTLFFLCLLSCNWGLGESSCPQLMNVPVIESASLYILAVIASSPSIEKAFGEVIDVAACPFPFPHEC